MINPVQNDLPQNIAQGADNLLINCARLKADESLLIIAEDPQLGWYDSQSPQIIADAARKIGVEPTLLKVGRPENELDPAVEAAIASHDCTIYFARIGDQDRFSELPPGKRSVMCYIRDTQMLASDYCHAYYPAIRAIKDAIDNILLDAEHIEISCPLGTRYSGRATSAARVKKRDVSVLRFPLGVPLPLEASRFSGRVALTHFLTPTGSKSYHPANIVLDDVSFANVENGRITGFSGNEKQVAKIEQHYQRVASTFDIDRDIVHSWHAGIHPASQYRYPASEDPDRWSNSVFTNPRFLHFHTCGNYAPAEICWMVLDHTICVDGINLWDKGRMQPARFAQTNSCLDQWPQLTRLFANPSQEIGLPDVSADHKSHRYSKT